MSHFRIFGVLYRNAQLAQQVHHRARLVHRNNSIVASVKHKDAESAGSARQRLCQVCPSAHGRDRREQFRIFQTYLLHTAPALRSSGKIHTVCINVIVRAHFLVDPENIILALPPVAGTDISMSAGTGYDEIRRPLAREKVAVGFLRADQGIAASGHHFHAIPMIAAGSVERYDERKRPRAVIRFGHRDGVGLNGLIQLGKIRPQEAAPR